MIIIIINQKKKNKIIKYLIIDVLFKYYIFIIHAFPYISMIIHNLQNI